MPFDSQKKESIAYLEQGLMTCAAPYASDMPHHLKASVKKTQNGDKKAWQKLAGEIIASGINVASTGPGQGYMTFKQDQLGSSTDMEL